MYVCMHVCQSLQCKAKNMTSTNPQVNLAPISLLRDLKPFCVKTVTISRPDGKTHLLNTP